MSASRHHKADAALLFRGEYRGRDVPELPNGLVWFPHEPTWQELADARLAKDLTKFEVELTYRDSYMVELRVAAKAEQIGVNIGGKFQEFQSTVWGIRGSFE